MNRRAFLQSVIVGAAIAPTFSRNLFSEETQRCVAITLDDPNTYEKPLFSAQERTDRILTMLKANNLRTALFVCGKRVDSEDGKALLKKWDDAGHMICNHSYSHLYFNAPKMPFEVYSDDFKKGGSYLRNESDIFEFIPATFML